MFLSWYTDVVWDFLLLSRLRQWLLVCIRRFLYGGLFVGSCFVEGIFAYVFNANFIFPHTCSASLTLMISVSLSKYWSFECLCGVTDSYMAVESNTGALYMIFISSFCFWVNTFSVVFSYPFSTFIFAHFFFKWLRYSAEVYLDERLCFS